MGVFWFRSSSSGAFLLHISSSIVLHFFTRLSQVHSVDIPTLLYISMQEPSPAVYLCILLFKRLAHLRPFPWVFDLIVLPFPPPPSRQRTDEARYSHGTPLLCHTQTHTRRLRPQSCRDRTLKPH